RGGGESPWGLELDHARSGSPIVESRPPHMRRPRQLTRGQTIAELFVRARVLEAIRTNPTPLLSHKGPDHAQTALPSQAATGAAGFSRTAVGRWVAVAASKLQRREALAAIALAGLGACTEQPKSGGSSRAPPVKPPVPEASSRPEPSATASAD